MKLTTLSALLGLGLFLTSCSENTVETVTALKPVYGNLDDLNSYIVHKEKDLENPGKIYVKGNLLLINEILSGIHVYDNTDPSDPVKLTFISIPGNLDVSIKGDRLYANYLEGLLTLDISDIENVKVMNYNTELESLENTSTVPPSALIQTLNGQQIYFECVDPSKGMVIAWETEKMPKPNCFVNR